MAAIAAVAGDGEGGPGGGGRRLWRVATRLGVPLRFALELLHPLTWQRGGLRSAADTLLNADQTGDAGSHKLHHPTSLRKSSCTCGCMPYPSALKERLATAMHSAEHAECDGACLA